MTGVVGINARPKSTSKMVQIIFDAHVESPGNGLQDAIPRRSAGVLLPTALSSKAKYSATSFVALSLAIV